MSPPAKCCNPLKKKSHTNFREKLCLISNNWDSRFSALYGLHVCSKCKVQLYREKENIQFVSPETEKNCENSENVSGNVTDIECGKKKMKNQVQLKMMLILGAREWMNSTKDANYLSL